MKRVAAVTQALATRFGQVATGVCPSSRMCLSRVILWGAINLGTIAPVVA